MSKIMQKYEFEHQSLKCIVMQLGYYFNLSSVIDSDLMNDYETFTSNWFVGYVRVNAHTHPAVYNFQDEFDVHGGITFYEKSLKDELEDNNYFWLGWDGNHGTKFSFEDAVKETTKLAEQLFLISPEAHGLI